jgi:hypothetical protein
MGALLLGWKISPIRWSLEGGVGMGKDKKKKVKDTCCESYVKKGKRCGNCPDQDKEKTKKKDKDKKKEKKKDKKK